MCFYKTLNLEAEMARHEVSKGDVAKLWGCDATTVTRKLNRRNFTVDEAVKLRNLIDSSMTLEYLFLENVKTVDEE